MVEILNLTWIWLHILALSLLMQRNYNRPRKVFFTKGLTDGGNTSSAEEQALVSIAQASATDLVTAFKCLLDEDLLDVKKSF